MKNVIVWSEFPEPIKANSNSCPSDYNSAVEILSSNELGETIIDSPVIGSFLGNEHVQNYYDFVLNLVSRACDFM